jgi:PadR family transcriptional regulator PadR
MDTQMKKGMLDACVLVALEQGESYGYKIIEDTRPVIEISESTLYPILKRLEQGGYLTVQGREHNGRLRKYYQITTLGLGRLTELRKILRDMDKLHQYILKGESK